MAILIAYIFFFVAASASPLQRRWLATKHSADLPGQVHLAFYVTLIVAVLGLVLPIFEPLSLQGRPIAVVALAILCGVFGAAFFVLSYVSQKHVDAGVSSIVSNIYTPITIVLATVFLGESLGARQIAGTVLLLIGMVIVSKKHQTGKFKFDKYFVLMAISGICMGVVLTAERALQKETGFTAGTLLSWWFQCGALGVVALYYRARQQFSTKDILVTGTLRFLQSLSWVILIFVVGNLSVVSAVTTFKVVVIFVFAALLLNERDDLGRKTVGCLIALVGLLLMK